MDDDRLRLLLTGLAAGDSLGSTSEFVPQDRVPEVYAKCRKRGWPFRQVGGGSFRWKPGEPTDDTEMALCMVRSCLELGRFDGEDVGRRFVEWMRSGPRDIGGTTRRTLRRIAGGAPWYEGGLDEYRRNPNNAANGSLMRNGVVPGMAEGLEDAFRMTVHHGITTHYAPLPVLCCAAQTYLIENAHRGGKLVTGDWLTEFREAFTAWLGGTDDEVVRAWRGNVGDSLEGAWKKLEGAEFDPDSFNPFKTDFTRGEGYCLLTLQIAVWAAAWSVRNEPFPTPEGFPGEVFQRTGPWTLSWVVMVGHDSDTYAATAGPIIAAVHDGLPEEMTQGLEALEGGA